jgi:hypothetical protein
MLLSLELNTDRIINDRLISKLENIAPQSACKFKRYSKKYLNYLAVNVNNLASKRQTLTLTEQYSLLLLQL